MELVSRRELGRRTNIPESTIRDYIKYDKITVKSFSSGIHGEGDLIYEIAVSELLKIRPELMDTVKINKPRPSQKPKLMPEREKLIEENWSYADAERREKIAKAQIAELNLAEKQGELVNKSDVNKALYGFGAEIRSSILSVPDRIIDNILACNDRNEAHLLLTIELTKALLALTDIEKRKLTK